MSHIYLPTPQPQINSGDKYGKYNCTAYCLAVWADAVTMGGVKVTGKQVRAWSTEPVPDPASPGLNLLQVQGVARAELHMTLQNMTGQQFGELTTALGKDAKAGAPNRRVIAQIEYAKLGKYRCQVGGDFGHALVLLTYSGSLGIRGYDPLCKAIRWYPTAVIREAMQAFEANHPISGGGLWWAESKQVPRIV